MKIIFELADGTGKADGTGITRKNAASAFWKAKLIFIHKKKRQRSNSNSNRFESKRTSKAKM